jgi:uncharacterized protein involved in type VI secretion and phage assembly
MTATLPRSRSTDRRYYGVHEALVAKVENDPAKECRVKLRYPWFDGGRTVSDWCRVVQLYAGNGYGAAFGPEKDDEVLVGFVHGDMRFPIVLGGLYNGKDKPPTHRAPDKDQKLIRTKHGHEVVLDDTPGAEAVKVTTAGGHAVRLDDAGRTVVVEAPGGVTITLEDGGTITVRGTTVKLDARTIELGSPVGEHLLLGQRFLNLFNTHTHTLVPPLPIPTTPPIVPILGPAVFSNVVQVSPT